MILDCSFQASVTILMLRKEWIGMNMCFFFVEERGRDGEI